jgi:4-amino-4-deoxy-L-arabinose transferase-like glycosyltransferase
MFHINGCRRISKELVGIFLIAFIIRMLFMIASQFLLSHSPLGMDYEYGVIARSVMEGHGYSVPVISGYNPSGELILTGVYRPTANQLPFYTLLLAGIYSVFPGFLAPWIMKILQAGAGAFSCILIYLLGKKLFNPWTGRIAGWVSVIFPGFIIGTARLTPEPFFTLFLVMSIYSLCRYRENLCVKCLLVTGCLFGVTLLNSNVLIPIIPVIALWILTWKGKWKFKIQTIVSLFAIVFICVLPWLVRNYQVFHKFPLFKSTMGLNFYLGNHPQGTGTFFLKDGTPIEVLTPQSFKDNFHILETEQDDILMRDAKVFIKENPQRFAGLLVTKFYYFTWFPPLKMLSREGVLYKKVFGLPYGLLLLLSVIGILYGLRKLPRETLFMAGIYASVAALYAIFIVGHQRYRMPVEPYLIILAAYGIYEMVKQKLPPMKCEAESGERK